MCLECLSCIMVWWILMIKHSVYYLANLFYIHVSSCIWRVCSWQVKEKHPRRLWRRSRAEEDKARINRHVSGESFLSSYFLFCTLESIACKFHEYVGNPRPSVIRCSFLYNKWLVNSVLILLILSPSEIEMVISFRASVPLILNSIATFLWGDRKLSLIFNTKIHSF